MVVDIVICHWVVVVASTEVGVEGIGEPIQELALFFYADGGLVESLRPERLQTSFNVLADLLYQVDLSTNMWNMVIVDFRPCYIPAVFLELVHMRREIGVGIYYQEILWRMEECPE